MWIRETVCSSFYIGFWTWRMLTRWFFSPILFPSRGKGASAFSPSHPLLPLRQKQQKTVQGEDPPGRNALSTFSILLLSSSHGSSSEQQFSKLNSYYDVIILVKTNYGIINFNLYWCTLVFIVFIVEMSLKSSKLYEIYRKCYVVFLQELNMCWWHSLRVLIISFHGVDWILLNCTLLTIDIIEN